ncbi:DUF4405 domain-containing protein [Poseidonibacter sp.]|uniref:DUF4405 domain-containing protein n=1 Tax=Poseidonibacter sp. TaxID=2321188 RepID=UPI003C7203E0
MKTHQKRELATSLTTFLFLVIAITGVLMYFHILDNYTKQMHEILGLAFVVIIIFHVYYNWKSMKKYFSNKVFFLSAGLIASIALGFILTSSSKPSPKGLIIKATLSNPIEKSSILFVDSYEKAEEKLLKMGIKIEKGKSIREIADKNNISPFEIIEKLVKE